MKKIIKLTSLFLMLVFFISLPYVSIAQEADQDFLAGDSLVPCGTEKTDIVPATATQPESGGEIVHPCEFGHLLMLINRLVHFILFTLAIPIAVIMFVYAGFLMIFSGGESHSRTKAKGIFWNVVFGLIIAAAAWLIINTLLTILGYTGDWTHF